MFSDEIRSVMSALGVLAGKIGEDEWALVRLARQNLGELADRVEAAEGRLVIPTKEGE